MAMYGSIGKLGIADRVMATNQAIAFARPSDAIDSLFLFWFLWSQRTALAQAGKGATQKNISQTIIKGWPIPLPPRVEQGRIVAAIEEQLSRIERATGELSSVRAKAAVWVKQIVSASLEQQEFPRELLGRLCPIFVDCPHRTPHYAAHGIPALRPRDVVGGVLRLESAARVDLDEFRLQTQRRIPQGGDVVYSRELSYGWAAVIPPDTDVCLSQGMVLLRPDDRMSPEFLALVLNSPIGRTQAEGSAIGSAHPHINLRNIRGYSIPVPAWDVQADLVDQLSELSRIRARLDDALSQAERRAATLRRAILARAFRGELVPQDPDDEPASLLLERIAAERAAVPAKPRRKRVAAGG